MLEEDVQPTTSPPKVAQSDPDALSAQEIRSRLSDAKLFEPSVNDRKLMGKLIERSFELARAQGKPLGRYLAASFDLAVAATYYKAATSSGWVYCNAEKPRMVFFPYVNACPRCLLKGKFEYHKAKMIGSATSTSLLTFYCLLFERTHVNVKLCRGREPIDLILRDSNKNNTLIGEIKAAPLITPPIAAEVDILTEPDEEGEVREMGHSTVALTSPFAGPVSLFVPSRAGKAFTSGFVRSNAAANSSLSDKALSSLGSLVDNPKLFETYFEFWNDAFSAYDRAAREPGKSISPLFWFTNGSGQPSPRPPGWPKRSGGSGFESVSDGKSSVGMDRTDDIKKGTYQVLKLGTAVKPIVQNVRVALLSNVHAIRHYKEYFRDVVDVIWAKKAEGTVKNASDLDPNERLYNLFDALISFTESGFRDEWLRDLFSFDRLQ